MTLSVANDRCRGPASSVRRRATALLVTSLCLIALQYLPFHLLAEAHHPSEPLLEAAGTVAGQSEGHGSSAPAHPALDHQSATPACRVSFGTDLATSEPLILAPSQGMPAPVPLVEVPVPLPPDIGPVDARGPPAAVRLPARFTAIPA